MSLNEAGRMVQDWLARIPNKFPGVLVDSFQVMPNHLHAILAIMGGGLDMAAKFGLGIEVSDSLREADNDVRYSASNESQTTATIRDPSLGRIVQWFKTMTTNNYIRGVRDLGWRPFPKRLWQRDYFDHVIRNEITLERTRDYIRDNPIYWAVEKERPDRMGKQNFAEWLVENEL
jgi:REP element-mobilizing transposase RayT